MRRSFARQPMTAAEHLARLSGRELDVSLGGNVGARPSRNPPGMGTSSTALPSTVSCSFDGVEVHCCPGCAAGAQGKPKPKPKPTIELDDILINEPERMPTK